MRYKYYTSDNKVICVSHYAGKPVRGIAKCDPKDTFNLDTGTELATLRCDKKIAEKRVDRAKMRYKAAVEAVKRAQEYERRMHDYYTESAKELFDVDTKLMELERKI